MLCKVSFFFNQKLWNCHNSGMNMNQRVRINFLILASVKKRLIFFFKLFISIKFYDAVLRMRIY